MPLNTTIQLPKEGEGVAVLSKQGPPVAGVYLGTIPGRHDASDWFRRQDRWIIAEDDNNVVHVPTAWILKAVVAKEAA